MSRGPPGPPALYLSLPSPQIHEKNCTKYGPAIPSIGVNKGEQTNKRGWKPMNKRNFAPALL